MNPSTASPYYWVSQTPQGPPEMPVVNPPQNPGSVPPQPTEALHKGLAGPTKKPNVEVEITEEQPLDPPLTEPSYSTVSIRRSARLLVPIIAGNCLCSSFICLCLWSFSTIEDLDQWQKRAFNALSLLLSAALGFGIGFLLDRIGLFARGTVLQCKSHSVKEVCINLLPLPYVWAYLMIYRLGIL